MTGIGHAESIISSHMLQGLRYVVRSDIEFGEIASRGLCKFQKCWQRLPSESAFRSGQGRNAMSALGARYRSPAVAAANRSAFQGRKSGPKDFAQSRESGVITTLGQSAVSASFVRFTLLLFARRALRLTKFRRSRSWPFATADRCAGTPDLFGIVLSAPRFRRAEPHRRGPRRPR